MSSSISPLSFPPFLYWFRVSEKGGQKSNGLAFKLGNTFFFFFSGREVSYPFISFQVYTLLSSGYWRFIEKKKGLELLAFDEYKMGFKAKSIIRKFIWVEGKKRCFMHSSFELLLVPVMNIGCLSPIPVISIAILHV